MPHAFHPAVPPHLRKYLAVQEEQAYSSIDHAIWRYVVRRNVNDLADQAHRAYLPGLRAAGIPIDSIPSVARMHEHLAKLEWGAVAVDGLFPSAVSFEFQGHGLLPIPVDIRSLEHLEHTPLPDIIHGTAGHAPM
ncbi:MAG: hypothetical protein K6T83_17605, partial [Alicyclobacillus sp.]|nr:hypothetical protein [Alicyclobacillus sp.]